MTQPTLYKLVCPKCNIKLEVKPILTKENKSWFI